MSDTTPAGPQGPAGFWSARPLGRILLAVVTAFMTVSLVSDLVAGTAINQSFDSANTLVSLLITLAFYVLWVRSTFAFVALIPSLIASHLLDSFSWSTFALPVMLGVVAATANRLFSYVALGIAVLWTCLIRWTSPDNAAAIWIALIFIGLAWGTGNFVWIMLDRRQQDQVRVAEATRRAALAAQEERRSLARDLHDIVAHNLTIISMQARAAKYAGTDASAREAVDVIGDSAGEALVDLRRMLSLLQAEGLVAGDQEAAQRELGEGASALDLEHGAVKFGRMLESLGVLTTVETDGLGDGVPQSVETALYRVLQEAVTNVAKHAEEGGECRICIRAHGGQLELAVENTVASPGSPGRIRWNSSGSGLIGMRDRVDAFGGTLSSGNEGGWWKVHAQVPLHGAHA
ncbi:histidine kinase [Citricoccus sp. GCM10030269]|uniref:histidine kinase n=1 Tax=Citricoccus sp. GCM10030269 TaxID=3273388 RepID=UPI0036161173